MSGGLPKNFTFKRRKGRKVKARKFDIGAQLRKESQPVQIEKTKEEKAAEEATTTSEWQEDKAVEEPTNSFKSNFGSIQEIVEDQQKKPQEHVLKRKTREDGRAIIQNVIMAAKEGKKKPEPKKEKTKPKIGVYRPGSWMSKAKNKFKMSDEAFPAMNPKATPATSAPAVAANSVWAPVKSAEPANPVAQTTAAATAKSITDDSKDSGVASALAESPPVPPVGDSATEATSAEPKKKKNQ